MCRPQGDQKGLILRDAYVRAVWYAVTVVCANQAIGITRVMFFTKSMISRMNKRSVY